jgi:hypothetical protein
MRLPTMRVRSLLRLLALTGLTLVSLAGCGSSSEERHVNPEALLDQATGRPLSSGDAEIELRIQVQGISALSGPLTLTVEGPYVSGHGLRIPSVDWELNAGALGFPVEARVVSTGDDVYLNVYGSDYRAGPEATASVNSWLQQASAGDEALPGIDLGSWLGRPTYVGEDHLGGADCAQIEAPLRSAKVARDLSALTTGSGLAAPPDVRGTATACVGFDDHVIHGLTIEAELRFSSPDRARLGGASGAHVRLEVENSDAGEPQQISRPEGGGYRPLRDLLLDLSDLGVPVPL